MKISEVGLERLELKYERLSARRPGAEKRLLASLSESGQQSPVIVVAGGEAGRYIVVDGHKRVRALKRLKADVARVAIWEMDEARALATAYQLGQGLSMVSEIVPPVVSEFVTPLIPSWP